MKDIGDNEDDPCCYRQKELVIYFSNLDSRKILNKFFHYSIQSRTTSQLILDRSSIKINHNYDESKKYTWNFNVHQKISLVNRHSIQYFSIWSRVNKFKSNSLEYNLFVPITWNQIEQFVNIPWCLIQKTKNNSKKQISKHLSTLGIFLAITKAETIILHNQKEKNG